MADRSRNSMLEAIKQLTDNIPEAAFKTFTSDRGKEFSCWEEVEKMGIGFYFADAYCFMAERMQREQQRPSKRILPKEDRHIKSRNRRLDKNLNADKLKTKKMFKLCNTI